MRKLRFTLFMLCMSISNIMHAYDFSAVNSDGVTIYYNIIDGGCEVTSGDNSYSGEVNIPSEVVWNSESYSVTSIGKWAFDGCSGLTSVTIPNSVTRIGYMAFYKCSGLTSVTIPNSVTSIRDLAFTHCSGLTSVTIPNSVTSIGGSAFSGCSGLTSVTIPNSVTSIAYDAFSGCTGFPVENGIRYADTYLIEVVDKQQDKYSIKEGTKYIGTSAFSNCSNLTSVTIPKSVVGIGTGAFKDCYSLTSIVVAEDNEKYDSRDNCNAIIDKGTHTLIVGCKNTEIPNSVTSIGEEAFCGCSGLTSVSIPNSVTTIGYYAFSGCSGLTSLSIPNSVTSISFSAFQNCSGLTSVSIPNSVTSISFSAFQNCSGLTSVSIPNSVTSISLAAFCNCSGLTSITIPNSVTSIGDWAFDGCSSLTTITIPNSVTEIGNYTFRGCSCLTDIYNNALTPQIINNDVFSTYQTLHVNRGCKTAYENADYWNQFTIVEDLLHDVPVTDINNYDNIIFFNPTTARPGKQVVMPLMMNNKDKITAMQFNVVLPEGVSLDKNSKGKYALKFNENAERADASSHTLSSNLQDDGSILVLSYSVDNTIFSGNNGAVIDFPITLAENIEPGGYPITLKNVVMTKSNKEEINIGEIVCLLEVPDYKQGDANNDNIINVTDIVYTADHILGNSDANFNPKAVDMNEDNIINVTDIVYIADMILSGNANNAKAMPAKSTSRAAGESTLNIVPFNIAPGGNKTVTLDMDNPGREITAFQFDMYLPEGLTIDKKTNGKFKLTFNSDTERTDASCHTLAASQQDDGAITFLCYSVDKDAFTGEQGAIVDIPFTASASMPVGVFDISLRNILLTCTDKSEIKPADCIVKVTVGNPTAISELSERNTADAFYNINGMRQSAMNNGINIVRMSNGTVKKIVK